MKTLTFYFGTVESFRDPTSSGEDSLTIAIDSEIADRLLAGHNSGIAKDEIERMIRIYETLRDRHYDGQGIRCIKETA